MNLYIYGEFSKEVTDITLKDGCFPCIGDQVSEQLEPALWFKVLVLDAISIDCNKRVILWHTSSDLEAVKQTAKYSCDDAPDTSCPDFNQPSLAKSSDDDHHHGEGTDGKDGISGDVDAVKQGDNGCHHSKPCSLHHSSSRRFIRRQMSETVYAGGECMGYSGDMDEVFEFTQDILSKLVRDEISRVQFNKEIFRLLHIYVLPNIHLSADDVINVQNALAIIDCYITDVDTLIMDKQVHIDHIQRDMKTQRQKYIQEVCEPGFNNAKFSLPFAEVLHRQLTEDISTAQDLLEELTKKIEAAKDNLMRSVDSTASSESATDCGGDDELSHLRSERSRFMKEFNDLLTARAILDEYMSSERAADIDEKLNTSGSKVVKRGKNRSEKRKSKKRSSQKKYDPQDEINPLHAVYMGMEETCQQMLADTLTLADRKVLLLSVKETMRGVFETLLSGRETLGIDIDTTGMRRPTDVLRHSQIPREWLSLPEQVSSILNDGTLPLKDAHQKFCELVIEKCSLALRKRKLSVMSDTILRESSPPEASLTETGGLFAENKLYNLRHTDSNSLSSGISSNASDSDSTNLSNLSRSNTYNPNSVNCSCLQSSSLSHELLLLEQELSSPNNAVPSGFHGSSVDSNFNVSEVEQVSEDMADLELALNWVKDNVNKMFEEICVQIQQQLGIAGQTQFRKIWQFYESHFYAEVIGSLSELYVGVYSSKIRHVLDKLHLLAAKDLDLSGFILHVLEDKSLECEFTVDDNHITSRQSDVKDGFISSGEAECNKCDASLDKKTFFISSDETASESTDNDQLLGSAEETTLISPTDISGTDRKTHSEKVSSGSSLAKSNLNSGTPLLESSNHVSNDSNIHNQSESCCVCVHHQTNAARPSTLISCSDGQGLVTSVTCKDSVPSSSNSLNSQSSQSSGALLSSDSIENELSTSASEQSISGLNERSDGKVTCKMISIANPAPMTVTWNVYRENTNQDAGVTASSVPMSPMTMSGIKSLRFKSEYRMRFAEAYKLLDQVLDDKSPLFKLQHLFRCLRELSDQYEHLQKLVCGQSSKPCTDDLIDILAVFLCNFDAAKSERLYAHIMMLSDLMPRFFAGGQFSFTLVQFFAAFQVLQERTLMKNVKQQLK